MGHGASMATVRPALAVSRIVVLAGVRVLVTVGQGSSTDRCVSRTRPRGMAKVDYLR